MDIEGTMFLGSDPLGPPGEGPGHYLLIVQGADTGRRIPVAEQEAVQIGRHADATLCLQDPGVSGSHCRVELEGRHLTVKDLGSTNGTFVAGERVQHAELPVGEFLQIGQTVIQHELRTPSEVVQLEQLSELTQAGQYVRSLLPEPWTEGPVRTNFEFQPSAELGGDALGYHRVDEDRVALYLIDVCGHGVRPALHSVAVINMLRQHALPGCDFSDPASVLTGLNAAFPMSAHDGMFFTIWYGVYDAGQRTLSYASGGHPPALLWHAGELQRLQTRQLPVGALPGHRFQGDQVELREPARLFILSDGLYEIYSSKGPMGCFDDFAELVSRQPDASPRTLVSAVQARTPGRVLQDDGSLLVVDLS